MKKNHFVIFLVFSFFLVFSCSKKSDSKKSNEEQVEKSENSLQSSSQSEKNEQIEAERLESEILKSIENFSDAQIEYNSLESNEIENLDENLIEIPYEEENKEIFVVDNSGKLKIYFFESENQDKDKEILIPEKEDGFTVLTSANKKIITRSFYDDFGRFCKKEEWKIPNVENPSLEKSTIYEYDDENFSPTKKIILENNYKTEFEYDKNENPIKMAKFYILQTEDESQSFLINQTEYSYDENQKLVYEKSVEKNYSEDYKTETSSLEKKFLYSYPNEDEIPADFSYFEDGILRIKNEYSAEKGSYVSQVFFDENYSVKTYYKENQKKKDVYILDGKVVREKNYD